MESFGYLFMPLSAASLVFLFFLAIMQYTDLYLLHLIASYGIRQVNHVEIAQSEHILSFLFCSNIFNCLLIILLYLIPDNINYGSYRPQYCTGCKYVQLHM